MVDHTAQEITGTSVVFMKQSGYRSIMADFTFSVAWYMNWDKKQIYNYNSKGNKTPQNQNYKPLVMHSNS